ncbi:MAG: hypothetical protein ACYS14_10440, partial [Planctomycetota bacterium]
MFNNSAFLVKFFTVSAELAMWVIKVFTGPTVVINSDAIDRIEDIFLHHLEEEENILHCHFFGRWKDEEGHGTSDNGCCVG